MVKPYTDDDLTKDMNDIFNVKTQEEEEEHNGDGEIDLDILVNTIVSNMEGINQDDEDTASIHDVVFSSDDDVEMEELPAPAVQEFAAPAVQELPAPAVQEFAAPAVQELPAPAVQEFAAPAVQEFAAPAVQEFAAPAVQEFAAPAVQEFAAPSPVNMNDLVFSGTMTKSHHAYNMLRCIAYMAGPWSYLDSTTLISAVYGNRPNICNQIQEYVSNPKNGVTHDPVSRTIRVDRGKLYPLVKGSGFEDVGDRIITYFGHPDGNITQANHRKNFSGLVTAWQKRGKNSGHNGYLNKFEYVATSRRDCYFTFSY